MPDFQASFKLQIYATPPNPPADGFCLAFSTNLPGAGGWPGPDGNPEEGLGSGLSICIDTFDNGGGEAPAFDVFWGTVNIGHVKTGPLALNNAAYIDVQIALKGDGKLESTTYGTNVFTDLQTAYTPMAGGFVLGGRTGSYTETHWVDDLRISTFQNVTQLGGQVALGAGFVMYTPPTTASGLDWFFYLVSDGQVGGTVWDTKYLNVQAGGQQLQPIQMVQVDATHYQVSWPAGTTQGVHVEYRDDLTPGVLWATDAAAVIVQNPGDGSGTATVTVPAGHASRFYRTAL